MKRILALIVAAGLGSGWAAPAQAQLVPYIGSPYITGTYVTYPSYAWYYTPTYYYTTPTYYYTTPTYYTSSYSYPSTTSYSTGYSGYRGLSNSVPPPRRARYYTVPSTSVYTYAYPAYAYTPYYYYPYRRGALRTLAGWVLVPW